MRILGFSKKDWVNYLTDRPKLEEDTFTTFRFKRRDKDWQVGEVVQVVYKPRSKDREVLGTAEIIAKEPRCMAWHGSRLTEQKVTNEEAIADGFADYFKMWEWLWSIYDGQRLLDEPMNKLALKWVERSAK